MGGGMSITADVERVLGTVSKGVRGGPLLVVTVGIHGNEPAGLHAMRRVLRTLSMRETPMKGRLAAFVGNQAGLARNVRFVDEDMNRLWSRANVEALRQRDPALDNVEQREQRDLFSRLESELSAASEKVTHLDLHSTSGDGPPFTVIAGPEHVSRATANNLGVPLLLGFESVIAGTLIEYMGSLGHSALILEGGQNEAPATIDNHESAVWLTLMQAGVLEKGSVPDVAEHRARLVKAARGLPGELEICYRHRLDPDEAFRMLPGFASFDPVVEGQLLAHAGTRYEREVRAPETATLIMPRYQGLGLDGFFLARCMVR